MAMLVKIHPVSRRHGYKCRSFTLAGSQYPTFRVERGWYKVDDETAAKLRTKRNNSQDPRSAPIFVVCTEAEATAMEEAEKIQIATPAGPVPMPKAVTDRLAGKDVPREAAKVAGGKERPFASRGSKEANIRAGKFLETADDESEDIAESTGTGTANAPVNPMDEVTRLRAQLAKAHADLRAQKGQAFEAAASRVNPEPSDAVERDALAAQVEATAEELAAQAELDATLDEALPDGEDLTEPMGDSGVAVPSRPATTPTVDHAREVTGAGGGDLTSAEVRANATPDPKPEKPAPKPPAAQAPKLKATTTAATPKPTRRANPKK